MMRCWRRRSLRCRHSYRARAAAVVEFAVVLPLLLLILFGIIEYGYTFMVRLTVQHAAREGCRVASLSTSTPADVAAKVAQAMGTRTYTLAHDILGDCQERVTVTVPRDDVAITGFFTVAESYFGGGGPDAADLKGSTTMRKEGCTPP